MTWEALSTVSEQRRRSSKKLTKGGIEGKRKAAVAPSTTKGTPAEAQEDKA